ncbi:MAG: dihydroorotate dehydrogenase electron transfer subunit [Endomicrobiales bacterium]|jgi:dihydroorotate dehydrogenase electron transfer subunit
MCLVVDAPAMARSSCPGQFFMLTVPGVFLRRPLSVYCANKRRLSFLYKVIGRGTELLSRMKPGALCDILGPLGTRYQYEDLSSETVPVIVAGGTGIASVNFLAQRLGRPGILFYGARTKKDLLCIKEFRTLGWHLHIATDDGSCGHKGFVTDIFKKFIDAHAGSPAEASVLSLFACGPKPMTDRVCSLAKTKGIECQISLEEMMACGLGNCQGCAVKIDDEYKMVCKDGPVFTISTTKRSSMNKVHKGCVK